MKPADYKCHSCGTIREISVEDTHDFPKDIPCLKCGKKAKRTYSPLYHICHQGSCGNYKNGYTSTGGNIKKT